MKAPETQIETESMLGTVSAFLVGLGVLSFALFPFLIPGLAILALLALPALPLLVVGGILAALGAVAWKAGRAAGRGIRALRAPRRSAPAGETG